MSDDESPRWNPGPVPNVGDLVQMQDQYGSRGWMRARVRNVSVHDDVAIVTVEGTDGGGRLTVPWGSRQVRSQ